MKKNETYKIGRSCTPSEMPVVVDVKNIIVITMTCGGGMGGSRWEEYLDAVDVESIPSNQMVTFTDAITGKKKTINTQYAVEVVEKQMLKVYQDVTAHRNYHKVVCKKAYTERYMVLDRDVKWECVMDYTNDSENKELVRTFSYEE